MDDVAMLVARVERIERQARRWRWAAVGLGAALVGVVAVGAGPGKGKPAVQDLVVAKEIHVVGDDGITHIKLRTIDNHPWLTLHNEKSETIARVMQNKFGGSFNALSMDGRFHVFLGSDEDGGHLDLWNTEHKPTVQLPAPQP